MTTLPISRARDHLSDCADRVAHHGERIIVERRGKNAFALVPVEDLELLELMEDRFDLEVIRERMSEPSMSLEKVRKELGL